MDAYTLELWNQVAGDAAKHARCGPEARCRVDAIQDVDALIDTIREMDVPNLPDTRPRAQHGG